MRRRTHPRRRRNWPVIFAVVTVLLVGSLIVPAVSFTTARVDRGSTFNVVSDSEGIHNLNVSQSVTVGQTNRLVTVTNHLGSDVTITVRLRSDSTKYGDLVVDGVTKGNETSFQLAAGSTQTVDLAVTDDQTFDGERVYFDIDATAPGLTVKAPDRNVPITL